MEEHPAAWLLGAIILVSVSILSLQNAQSRWHDQGHDLSQIIPRATDGSWALHCVKPEMIVQKEEIQEL